MNIDGVFFGLRDAIPKLEQSRGAVVVTASMAGVAPLAINAVVLAHEVRAGRAGPQRGGDLLARGIRINALCPGAVATPLMGEDPHAWFASRGITPLEPEDLAATVVELLGSDRSGEIVLHRAGRPAAAVGLPANSDELARVHRGGDCGSGATAVTGRSSLQSSSSRRSSMSQRSPSRRKRSR